MMNLHGYLAREASLMVHQKHWISPISISMPSPGMRSYLDALARERGETFAGFKQSSAMPVVNILANICKGTGTKRRKLANCLPVT
ncbi:hypothetical protein ACNKHU_16160 [Shigella flexneri]